MLLSLRRCLPRVYQRVSLAEQQCSPLPINGPEHETFLDEERPRCLAASGRAPAAVLKTQRKINTVRFLPTCAFFLHLSSVTHHDAARPAALCSDEWRFCLQNQSSVLESFYMRLLSGRVSPSISSLHFVWWGETKSTWYLGHCWASYQPLMMDYDE
jgi:hypothetical protein